MLATASFCGELVGCGKDVAAWLLGLWYVGEWHGTWALGLGPRKQGCLAGSSDSHLVCQWVHVGPPAKGVNVRETYGGFS